MKRLIAISVLSIAVSFAMSAQQPLDSVLSGLRQKTTEMEYSYVLTASGVKTTGNGVVTVQDSLYNMSASGLRMICDGKSVWVVDESGKEVMIESVAQGGEDYMNNPAVLLFDMNEFFRVEGSRNAGGRNVYVLSPKIECGITGGSVTVDTSGEYPVFSSCSFSLSEGGSVDIEIKSMVFVEKRPLTYFHLDISGLDSSWLITDLR